jgi:hypothetical protein
MAGTSDMILPTLREMKGRNAPLEDQTRVMVEGLHYRFQSVEAARVSLRHAAMADTLMARLVTREFAMRIESWERRVAELESCS